MIKELAVKRNLDLLNEFMKYAFDHPEVMDKIPPEADSARIGINDDRYWINVIIMTNLAWERGVVTSYVHLRRQADCVGSISSRRRPGVTGLWRGKPGN